MIHERALERTVAPNHPVAARSGQRRGDLIRALNSLLSRLQDRGGSNPKDGGGPGEGFDCWEDDAYCYIEVRIAGPPIAAIDVNLVEGRAFIRLER